MHGVQDEEPADHRSRHNDGKAAELHNPAQQLEEAEAHAVPQEEVESVLRRGAEGLAKDGNLYVGVLRQELQGPLQAPHAARQDLQDRLHHLVLLDARLLLQDEQEVPDELDDGDHKAPKCEGPKVVAAGVARRPPHHVAAPGKEPEGASAREHALAEGQEQGVVPEQGEEDRREAPVEREARGLAAPAPRLHARGAAVDAAARVAGRGGVAAGLPDAARRPHAGALPRRVLRALGLRKGREVPGGGAGATDLGEHQGRGRSPDEAEADANQDLQERHQDNLWVRVDKLRGHRVDANGQADLPAEAGDEDDPQDR
mmetsp:Transcript_112023/g.349121  ORF Transcript_112023/g.349121 Transcript_112023/m.349121 type:complete len:315 (+) Transcript_112023:358-1302(+)